MQGHTKPDRQQTARRPNPGSVIRLCYRARVTFLSRNSRSTLSCACHKVTTHSAPTTYESLASSAAAGWKATAPTGSFATSGLCVIIAPLPTSSKGATSSAPKSYEPSLAHFSPPFPAPLFARTFPPSKSMPTTICLVTTLSAPLGIVLFMTIYTEDCGCVLAPFLLCFSG